jgi:hypothetical protein
VAKKPAEYVHCTQCGYVGIDGNHNCLERLRAAADRIENEGRRSDAERSARAAELAEADRRRRDWREPTEVVPPSVTIGRAGEPLNAGDVVAIDYRGDLVRAGQPALRHIANAEATLRQLLGRPLRLVQQQSYRVDIDQRCGACGEAIGAYAILPPNKARELSAADFAVALLQAIGSAARKSYMLHRCKPITPRDLADYTDEELEQHFVDLERDADAMLRRASEVASIRKARG